MSDLTITTAGVSKSINSGNLRNGVSIRVSPTISGTAYIAGDVLCLTTEIPNFSRIQGGFSKVNSITVISAYASATQEDFKIVFMQKGDKHFRTPINPGAGPANITAADIKLAKVAGICGVDSSDNDLQTTNGVIAQGGVGLSSPGLTHLGMATADDSTSMYFTVICVSAVDFAADGDLELVFNIEYVD